MFPFNIKQTCYQCKKQIHSDEEIYARMRYPSSRGSTEIKAYLYQNTQVFCVSCMKEQYHDN